MPQAEEISKEDIKSLVEKAYAAGVKCNNHIVDPQMESALRKEIGDFNIDNEKYNYMKYEDASFENFVKTKGSPSFNVEIPTNFAEMKKFVLNKRKEAKDNTKDPKEEEEEEEQYQGYQDEEIKKMLDEMRSEPVENSKKDIIEDQKTLDEQEMVDKYGLDDMDYHSELFNKVKVKRTQKKGIKKEATHEFDNWDEASKDTEFWDK